MSEPLLAVRDLHVDLAGRTVLSNVSFTIARGAIAGLCGESGCGKTTLALALAGLLPSPPYRVGGEILLDGRDLSALPEAGLRRIRGARLGMVFQDSLLALNPVLTIRTQLREILRAHGIARDLPELLALAGLDDAPRILAAYPHRLSGGERQRVTIAQALACRPALVVADEPFTALDGPRVLELSALFRRLRDETGTSFLVISHSPGVLAGIAGEVLRMSGGRIAARGTAREVLQSG
ncbi:MAG: ABC transporter ATP-binding protein [Acidobacteria bacterium]|nr:ABC transporter ATP-binding protein [Acidobacteriota bacterium]